MILLALVELTGTAGALLHILGLALLGGRALHAYGISQDDENYRFRVAGMALTLSTGVAGPCSALPGHGRPSP